MRLKKFRELVKSHTNISQKPIHHELAFKNNFIKIFNKKTHQEIQDGPRYL